VGLVPGTPGPRGELTFCNDEVDGRVVITEGPRDDCTVLGYEAIDDAAFTAVSERLSGLGFVLTDASDRDAAARGVERLQRCATPWQITFELALGLKRRSTALPTPLVPGGFQTQGVGVGHVALAVLDYEASERFLIDGLGMVQSDWIETELMEGIDLEVRFYHCNSRHHSIALAKVPFDFGKSLHHFQVEVNERDAVGAAFDRAWDANLPFANGLGVHDNEGAFSFYVTTAAGFLVEVGHGTKIVTTPWQGNRKYDSISRWGHQPLPERTVGDQEISVAKR